MIENTLHFHHESTRTLSNLGAKSMREKFCLQIAKEIFMKRPLSNVPILYLNYLQLLDLLASKALLTLSECMQTLESFFCQESNTKPKELTYKYRLETVFSHKNGEIC